MHWPFFLCFCFGANYVDWLVFCYSYSVPFFTLSILRGVLVRQQAHWHSFPRTGGGWRAPVPLPCRRVRVSRGTHYVAQLSCVSSLAFAECCEHGSPLKASGQSPNATKQRTVTTFVPPLATCGDSAVATHLAAVVFTRVQVPLGDTRFFF